ncbi:MAG: helix-turn-helix domain-containing protein [Eubacteriales bacterium]
MALKLITDFYYSDLPMSTTHDRHKHNVYQILYIVEGSLSLEIAGNRISCSAPALVFIGNYEPHIILETSPHYVRYVITLDPYQVNAQIRPELLQSVLSFHPIGFRHALDITPIAEEIRYMIEGLYSEWKLPEKEKLAGAEALLLSAVFYRIRRFSPSHFTAKKFGAPEMIVAAARMELECNFAEKLNLDSLAERLHVSRYYLTHIFKQVTGYSLKEYLMLCRISFACQQLAESEQTISEIAELSGFNDMSNFARSFKEIIGITPSEFRKKTKIPQLNKELSI